MKLFLFSLLTKLLLLIGQVTPDQWAKIKELVLQFKDKTPEERKTLIIQDIQTLWPTLAQFIIKYLISHATALTV